MQPAGFEENKKSKHKDKVQKKSNKPQTLNRKRKASSNLSSAKLKNSKGTCFEIYPLKNIWLS